MAGSRPTNLSTAMPGVLRCITSLETTMWEAEPAKRTQRNERKRHVSSKPVCWQCRGLGRGFQDTLCS